MTDDNGGAAIKARRVALGLSVRSLATLADVDRGQLSQFEAGRSQPQAHWISRVTNALERAESEMGTPPIAAETSSPTEPGFIRFKVEGVYGAKALVVEGPVENLAELEEMVDRVMRRLAGQDTPDA